MKEDIEGGQKEETENQGQEDGKQGAQEETTMPAKPEQQKLDENGATSKNDSDGEERAEGSGQIATTQKNKKEPVHMSFDVWYDVLQFITRKEMADRFSLVCRGLKALCWPRLHGRKVTPHMVVPLSLEWEVDRSRTKAILWKDFVEKIPIATDPPPNYIQGFQVINIDYLNSEVIKFMRNISPLLANLHLLLWRINNRTMHNLRNLLDAINGRTTIAYLDIFDVSISEFRQQCPGLLENIPAITMAPFRNDQVDVNELIMAKLKIGKSFVLNLDYANISMSIPIGDIQKAFQTAKQPQSFFIILHNVSAGLEVFQLANEETGEVLALERPEDWEYALYRCPSGEVEQWWEEADKLLKMDTYTTRINVE